MIFDTSENRDNTDFNDVGVVRPIDIVRPIEWFGPLTEDAVDSDNREVNIT